MLETSPSIVSNIKGDTYKGNRFSIHTFYFLYQYTFIYQSLPIDGHFLTNENASL